MRTLPSRMMRHTATLIVPKSVTAWRDSVPDRTVILSHVRVQRVRQIRPTDLDIETAPTAELWFDARISQPSGIDLTALQTEAESANDYLRVEYEGRKYRALTVDELLDDVGHVHHWRLDLL